MRTTHLRGVVVRAVEVQQVGILQQRNCRGITARNVLVVRVREEGRRNRLEETAALVGLVAFHLVEST